MAMTVSDPTRFAGYQLRLPSFEGPLDVLLRLIERNQLAITEVSLVAVTDQFLAYVEALSEVPPEVLADFAAVATKLLVLKSRSLLPAPPAPPEEPEPEDLTRQLLAYQAVKQTAGFLSDRHRSGLHAYTRDPIPPDDLVVAERLAPVALASLVRAFQRCLRRNEEPPRPYAPRPVITLAAMTRRLLSRLGGRRMQFSVLVGKTATRTERAVGFIALLSLQRQRVVEAVQWTLFGEIEVERIRTTEGVAADD